MTRIVRDGPALASRANSITYAIPVPARPSASTEPVSFQPGIADGSRVEPDRRGQHGRDDARAGADQEGIDARELPRRERRAARVAERGEHDCKRREDPAAAGRAEEERDAGEADEEPSEPPAPDALEPETDGDEDGEDRCGALEDPGEARVDPGLGPREEKERDRRVHGPDDDERPPGGARLAQDATPPGDESERHEHYRSEQHPEEDERPWVDLPVRDADEHERRAPDQGEGGEEDDVAAGHSGVLTVGRHPA